MDGCHNYKHTDGKTYFIPGCMGAAVYGKERCTCYTYKGLKLSSSELISELRKENSALKKKLAKAEKLKIE